MFQKLVAIEPVSLVPSAEKALYSFAGQVVMYPDIPANDDEIIARIGDADAVLLSYTSRINRYVLECCPNVKYIGMCCSLYSPESANVDIRFRIQQLPRAAITRNREHLHRMGRCTRHNLHQAAGPYR